MTEPKMLTCAAAIQRAAPPAGEQAQPERTLDVVASTAVLDRQGEVLEQSWRLERYLANPVVLYAHDSWDLPIGTAENVRVEDGALRARIRLVSDEANPLAGRVWKLIQEGALRAVSVGFIPHGARLEKRARAEGELDEEYLVLSDNELLEISVVPVPANPEALAEIRQRALATSRAASPQEKTMAEKTEKAPEAPAPITPEEQALVAFARSVLAMVQELMSGEGEPMEDACKPEKALGALRGLVVGRKAADAAVTELATLKAQRETERREKLLADARADGRLSPGIEQAEAWKTLASGPVLALEAALAVLPKSVPTQRAEPRTGPALDELTPEDRHYARQAGLTEDDLRASMKRAQRPAKGQE